MLTLEEAILHAEEVAEKNEKECKNWAYGASQINDDESRKKQYLKHAEMWHECANEHRQLAEWLRELKRDREILDGLSIYFQSLVVDAVINQRPLMFDMRDATKEERESVKRYIADSAKTTGVNFWNLIGEVNADGDND
jgi:hypothetical protein